MFLDYPSRSLMLSHKREAERGDVNTEAEIAGSHQKLEEARYKFPKGFRWRWPCETVISAQRC